MKTNFRPQAGYSVSSAAWSSGGIEPPLKEMLSDPIVRAVMRRDKLTREDVERVLCNLRRTYRIEGANLAPAKSAPATTSAPQSGV